jgi:APA family basic amino acid/polyamine antiporter
MPIGMISSLVICTIIYIIVALVLTGMVPYKELGTAEPLATAFSALGMHWTAGIISLGAVFATTSVLVVFQLGQPRIFFSMARDGLLPPWAARVHPKYRTPHITTILTGVFVATFAAVANIDEIVQLTNIGTLFAFVLVAIGIIILRKTNPNATRPFRTPFVPVVPLLAVVSCGYLMLQLPWETWVRFVLWLALGLIFYFAYSVRHSVLRDGAS